MTETKPSAEDRLQSSLKDVLVIAEKMSPYCTTVEELIGIVRLAIENPGQLRIILELVATKR